METASRAANDPPRREHARGDLGDRGEVEVLVGDAGLFLEPRHDRVVQVPFGGEVAVHRAFADAGAFGDGAERERVPVPRVELVHELRACGHDRARGGSAACWRRTGLSYRRRSVPRDCPRRLAAVLDVALTMVTSYCHQLVGALRGDQRMPTHGELMDAAVAETGLDDFGDDSFREGLEILVRGVADEARLNAAGEGYLYPRITGYLAQRLQVEDWYRRHPEIGDERVAAPLIGLSLPRTGSTALSFLLAQDPDIRYLHMWESATPCPPPSTVVGDDPRVPEGWGPGRRSARATTYPPTSRGRSSASTCSRSTSSRRCSSRSRRSRRTPTGCSKPTSRRRTSTSCRVLKLLQWGQPTRPWRLKTPMHMLYLPYLDAVFPDARFVVTHRDPTDVMLSVCDVYADICGTFTDDLDRKFIGELNVKQWSLATDRALAFRQAGNDDRFYDIDFRAMQADPIGEVRGLYEWLGEPVSDEFASRDAAVVDGQRREPRARTGARPRGVRPRPRRDPAPVRRLGRGVRALDRPPPDDRLNRRRLNTLTRRALRDELKMRVLRRMW